MSDQLFSNEGAMIVNDVTFAGPLSIDQEYDLVLKIAIQLYTYGDFEKIQNPKDYAKECLHRGNEFVKAYKSYKGKIETLIKAD